MPPPITITDGDGVVPLDVGLLSTSELQRAAFLPIISKKYSTKIKNYPMIKILKKKKETFKQYSEECEWTSAQLGTTLASRRHGYSDWNSNYNSNWD